MERRDRGTGGFRHGAEGLSGIGNNRNFLIRRNLQRADIFRRPFRTAVNAGLQINRPRLEMDLEKSRRELTGGAFVLRRDGERPRPRDVVSQSQFTGLIPLAADYRPVTEFVKLVLPTVQTKRLLMSESVVQLNRTRSAQLKMVSCGFPKIRV